ncbi:hypothetical protein VKT23_011415 [Stygiomarasmius scandens]|uniref:Uncharacterized protein n=1 Tax=Marasmiellus scandens TaxID=2682957 RepID=A0ABR1JEJ6_9AGAR
MSKGRGVSTGGLFDLKAELAKQEQEAARNKASGNSRIVGRERPGKKPTIWSRQNAGVQARAVRDLEEDIAARRQVESARSILERKARTYDKLRRGKGAGLTEEQFSNSLVDFESKVSDVWESDSDDVDESLTVPQPYEDDPIVEYQDEFGRSHSAPKSEVPREFLPDQNKEKEKVHDDEVIYNPANPFAYTYEPTFERVEKITQEYTEENNPLDVHYDPSREVREKGAAFYNLPGNEEERRQKMEELRSERMKTKDIRRETGAIDIRPGEVEGMREGESVKKGTKRWNTDREARKEMLAAKRRKMQGIEDANPSSSKSDQAESAICKAVAPSPADITADPLASLEASVQRATKRAEIEPSSHDDADTFLASLEKDIGFGKRER